LRAIRLRTANGSGLAGKMTGIVTPLIPFNRDSISPG
jgi:hypothetical protein